MPALITTRVLTSLECCSKTLGTKQSVGATSRFPAVRDCSAKIVIST